MKNFLTVFLHFSRNEQIGLALLCIIMLFVIFIPKLFTSSNADTFDYSNIIRRIDSLTKLAESSQTSPAQEYNANLSRTPSYASRTPDPQQPYKPFRRDDLSLPVVDINSADTTALRLVRGIGAYFARQIVNYRTRLGGYAIIEQLLDIRNVTETHLEQWRPQLKIDTGKIIKIDLATADEEILKQHPYIGYYAARGIVHFRNTQGVDACTLEALVKNDILTKEVGERLKPYCEP